MNYVEINNLNSVTVNKSYEIDISDKILTPVSSATYYDVIYNNIHVIKNSFDVGYITSEVNYYFEIWNTYNENKSLDNINYGPVSGVYIKNQNGTDLDLPVNIVSKLSKIFQLNVTTSGDKTATGDIILTLDDTQVPIYVSLTRSFIFDYQLNLATNIEETYSYKTEVMQSVDSTEYRKSYIKNARYSFTYFYVLEGKEKRMLDKVLYSAATDVLTVPLYIYGKELTNISDDILTVDISNTPIQVGMQIMIKSGDKKDSATVTEIISNNQIRIDKNLENDYSYPVVYPLVFARINTENSSQLLTNHAATYTLEFNKEIDNLDIISTNNSTEIPMFNGLPLLTLQANTIEPHDVTFFRNVSVYDDGISKRQFKVNNEIAQINTSFDYTLDSIEAISAYKNFFKRVKGMYEEFYFFSNKQEFNVVENISASDTIITVENESLSSYYKNKYIKYAVIFYNIDQYKIIQINDIYTDASGNEGIVLNETFGINLNKDFITSCQFVYRSRMSSDDLTISYETNDIATTAIATLKLNKE